MPKIIAVANQKGGVAKTTTAVNLSCYLGNLGHKTLLIDIDPQANATSGVGIDKNNAVNSVYGVILGKYALESIICKTSYECLSIAPAELSLVGAEIELVNTANRELRLLNSFKEFVSINQYEYIIIDTPPSLGLLTMNALVSANSVLIPMQCEYYALEGLAQLYKTISLVKQNLNKSLYIEGLVFCMVDTRSNLSMQVIAEVKKLLQEKAYETVIPRNVRLAEAPGFGKPIMSYDSSSKGAQAYEKLAREFLSRQTPSGTPPGTVTIATEKSIASTVSTVTVTKDQTNEPSVTVTKDKNKEVFTS